MKRIVSALALLPLLACGPMEPTPSGLYGDSSAEEKFPDGPHENLTPGSLCANPDEYRYGEKIPYCKRSVGSDLKKDIIRQYDEELHYQIQTLPRNDFKIDHLIPLCMGGSNERSNLWPQHKSVYEHTDPIEQKLCELMKYNEMKQAKALEIIRRVKNDLQQAKEVEDALNDQLDGINRL